MLCYHVYIVCYLVDEEDWRRRMRQMGQKIIDISGGRRRRPHPMLLNDSSMAAAVYLYVVVPCDHVTLIFSCIVFLYPLQI